MPSESIHLPVAAAYDRWAPVYEAYDNPMVFMATHILAAEIPQPTGLDVFEFGCGTGRNLRSLLQSGARTATGCDISPGMLAHAPAAFQHDITHPLPLAPQSVDIALFSLSLEHIASLDTPLREARRILRPSGRICIIEIHPFLSANGVSAHFHDGAEEIHMPTFPHQFSNYFDAFHRAALHAESCREWRPADLNVPLPAKLLKRGPNTPIAVSFQLVPHAQ